MLTRKTTRIPQATPGPWFVMFVLILFTVPLFAKETVTLSDNQVDPKLINLRIETVQASTTLDEQTSAALLDLYRHTLNNLERTRTEKASMEELALAGSEAPEQLAETQKAIDELKAEIEDGESRGSLPAGVEARDQALSQVKAALNESGARLNNLKSQYAYEMARPAEARTRLATARTERDQALAGINAAPPPGQASELTEAHRWHKQSLASRLSAEVRKLEQELLSHEPRLDLITARQELAELQVETLRARARQLEDTISKQRGAEAEKALEDAVTARHELVGKHPLIAQVAAENVELGDQLTQRSTDINAAADERDKAQQQVTRLADEFNSTNNKLAIAGLNQTLGQLLVEQRRALPDIWVLKKQIRQRENLVAEIGLEQIELNEQRRDLRSSNGAISRLTAELTEQEAANFGAELENLFQNQVDLLDKSVNSGSTYLSVLGELDLAQRQLTESVTEYKAFLDRTLLWVRTTKPVNLKTLTTFRGHVSLLFSVSNLSQLSRDLARSISDMPIFVPVLIVLLALILFQKRFYAQMNTYSKYVGRISKDRFRNTLWVLFYTILVACALPMILIVGGFMLEQSDPDSAFSRGISSSLQYSGSILLFIRFFLVGSHDNGLLRVHCGWSELATRKIRKELRWFAWVFPVARILRETSMAMESGESLAVFTIIMSIISAGSFAILIFRLFTPAGGIAHRYVRKGNESLAYAVMPFWLIAVGSVLPVLVALWLAGYSYTAEVLTVSYMYSCWLVLCLKVLNDLLARWLRLGSQRLQYRKAIERRDAARAERAERAEQEKRAERDGAQDSDQISNVDEADFEVDESRIDFAELNSDSRFLLRMGVLFLGIAWLWVIWTPVIPALGILDDIILWTKSTVSNGETVQLPVSLMDILRAIGIAIATAVLTKSLPSLVELILIHSTKLNAGNRYTVNTLLRYTIIGTGVIIVISFLGVSWSKAQWLVAALGVGIGFGLQEIVANFISGLVILFERPIRVGDVVTVGETSGVVTRIQIRATTIRDYDRKELLVPNKEFITGRLLNWSLSDDITRYVIQVGIAYGSDVTLASKLAEEAARENPNVLEDPAPFVIFESFGDNALNLSLRVYLPSMEHRLVTVSNIHAAINQKFNDAGIVIAFPQRDIHLDTTTPLDINIHRIDEGSTVK